MNHMGVKILSEFNFIQQGFPTEERSDIVLHGMEINY